MKFTVVVCVSLTLAAPVFAQAQSVEMRSLVEKANKDEPSPSDTDVRKAVGATLSAASQAYGWCNPSAIAVTNVVPDTADAMIYSAIKARQARNGWTAVAKIEGCPGEDKLRMLVLRTPTALKAVKISGGEGLASFSEMRDALPNAKAAALIFASHDIAGCSQQSDATLSRTRVVGRASDGKSAYYGVLFKGDWIEAWTFYVCNASVEVPVRFRADGTGGAFFDVALKEVKRAAL